VTAPITSARVREAAEKILRGKEVPDPLDQGRSTVIVSYDMDEVEDMLRAALAQPAPEPTPEPALTFRDRAAQGKACLLKLSDGGQDYFRTVAGLRRQEPEAPDLFVGVGVFTGSQAELQIKAIALRGTLERVELSFEDGERVRGSALFREVQFLGDGNGEATYRIGLHLTEVEHV
jgi:predicted secreted protein